MLPASGPRRSHATAAACVAHRPLLLSGLDLCTPIHGSMRRAGVLILREALLGPQLNTGFYQSDDLFPRCASPPLATPSYLAGAAPAKYDGVAIFTAYQGEAGANDATRQDEEAEKLTGELAVTLPDNVTGTQFAVHLRKFNDK